MIVSSRASIRDGKLEGSPLLTDARVRRVFSALDGDGEELRIVGGAVRNALMGEAVADVDLATTAFPEVVQARAAKAGLRTIATGIEHGTVTVIVEGAPFEVTTLREDIDTFGRYARVRFGRDFEADARRRDFTINALSIDATGHVFDYCGGLADIQSRRVRFIGDAATRIREDYLRILRLFRFHAAYGEGDIDAEALQACIQLRDGLGQLSRERVRAELLKLLAARHAVNAMDIMSGAGILHMLLAGVGNSARLQRLVSLEAERGQSPDAVLRLCALAVLVHEDAARLRDVLRLSNMEETRLGNAARALTELHGRDAPPLPNDLYRFLFLHGRRASLDAIMLAHGESRAAIAHPQWASAFAFLSDTPEPRLPFSGGDLMKRGVHPGPVIGEMLKRLQAAWIRAGFPKEPDVLARLLDEASGK